MAEEKDPTDLIKNELKGLLDIIVNEEDLETEIADEAIQKLTALKISRMAAAAAATFPAAAAAAAGERSCTSTPVVPEEFRCPISGELMKDPVLLVTGQTYDRPFIEKWFHKGHNTCPRTKEVLSDMTLTPNRLLRGMILQWCTENGLELANLGYEEVVANASESHLDELLDKLLSSSLSDQKEAAKKLRQLTRWDHEFRALFAKLPESIERLLHPLSMDNINLHPDLQEDLVTTVLNISIHDNNKKHVGENPLVLPLLIQSLQYGNIEAKANAAAAIFTLSFHEPNKIIIGNAGAFNHLIPLLDEGHPIVIRDAASAIFNLCTILENKEKAVCSGAVGSILRNISHGVLVDELLSVLALLSTDLKAIDEMCKLSAVPSMLSIIRKTSSEGVKENCASILFAICSTDRTKLKEIQEDENANSTLLGLSRTGNNRARRKAIGILNRLHRAASITHTA